MRGFQKFSNNCVVFLFIVVSILIFGCGGERAVQRTNAPPQSISGFLADYEKSFNPTKYDASVGAIQAQERLEHNALEAVRLVSIAIPETIPGFRIQLLFTSEIDKANSLRDTLSNEFPDEWIYVVYDAPNYKVRIGNFPDRTSARPLLRKLIDEGYPDAWIVPDNVIKNPVQKLPEQFIVPDNHSSP